MVSYYDCLDRPESDRKREKRRLREKIKKFHQASRETYGSPRIHQDLQAEGEGCGVNRVASLMKAYHSQSKMSGQFVLTTDSRNTKEPAPDLIERHLSVAGANEKWVSDTTFIPTGESGLYLAVVLELYSRQVFG